jgi:hypothetical protein
MYQTFNTAQFFFQFYTFKIVDIIKLELNYIHNKAIL